MILYDYTCQQCGLTFEASNAIEDREHSVCPECKGLGKLIISSSRSRDWFKPGYWDDFGLQPVFVKSKEHLKELCKDHKVYSRALGPIDDRRGC
jgi:putative FmdB family regulatory protein